MRLDMYLVENCDVKSRSRAKMFIEKGLVLVNGVAVTKVAYDVAEGKTVEIAKVQQYASRGAYKLEKAVIEFDYDVKDKVFLDVGASNGGFTDYLLSKGAKKVYAIDVGENQLEQHLLEDKRVVVMDKTNAKNLTKEMFAEEVLHCVSDVSFISLKLIIPVLSEIVESMLLLIKPQFECGRSASNKNGIVTNKKYHFEAILGIKEVAKMVGMPMSKLTVGSSETGKNIEFMCQLGKDTEILNKDLENVVNK